MGRANASADGAADGAADGCSHKLTDAVAIPSTHAASRYSYEYANAVTGTHGNANG